MPDTYFGFPIEKEGFVAGELPAAVAKQQEAGEEIWSHMIEGAGFEVHCIRGEDEPDMMDERTVEVVAEVLREWEPALPAGEGWKLAWRAVDEDGPNVCFWRERSTPPATSI